MYAKKMLSAVAALAVISTGAMAFEIISTDNQIGVSLSDGTKKAANYTTIDSRATQANSLLARSADFKGDALIYPLFTQKMNDGTDKWETEISVRNTQNKAVIAKVALFRASDSKEVRDFNIYLTPYDVFRFKISGNKITTMDGSIVKATPLPNKGDGLVMNTHGELLQVGPEFPASEEAIDTDKDGVKTPGAESGYVVIYGMAQYNELNTYHGETATLAKDYRKLMDICRPGWRHAYDMNGMVDGVMMYNKTSTGKDPVTPSLANYCAAGYTGNTKGNVYDKYYNRYDLAKFGDVDEKTLVGSVKISNAETNNERDMLLNATAMKNYSSNNMIMWAPGEFADFADRGLVNNVYDRDRLLADAKAFLVDEAYYTFKAGDVQNTLLVTQPMKRILMQSGEGIGEGYWQDVSSRGWAWGTFTIDYNIFDENETSYAATVGLVQLVSPYTNTGSVKGYDFEVQPITDIQARAKDSADFYKDGKLITDGFVPIKFQGNANGLPAIVTQMTGSVVNGKAQTNWIYAPVTHSTSANK